MNAGPFYYAVLCETCGDAFGQDERGDVDVWLEDHQHFGPGSDGSQTSANVDVEPHPSRVAVSAPSGSASHGHFYGWSERHGAETFEHEHERGDEPHEHVLRDGGTEVKRTTWGPTRAADVPGQS